MITTAGAVEPLLATEIAPVALAEVEHRVREQISPSGPGHPVAASD